jgi:hypothetical protein
MSVIKKRICLVNIRFCCLKCEMRVCQIVKDRIPMNPAVIWNSSAVRSLTENWNFPFHMKLQWILGASLRFCCSGGGGAVEERHCSLCTASSIQNVAAPSVQMLYHTNRAPCHKFIRTNESTTVNTYTGCINSNNPYVCSTSIVIITLYLMNGDRDFYIFTP